MDAHYDQVMKAREGAGGGTKRYFAYSTVLDREAFEEWRAQHSYDFFNLPAGELGEAMNLSLVFDFPSRWWGGRVAGLQASPGQQVCGRVFEIAEKDWPIVQHKEGFVTGMCIELPVKVRIGSTVVDAIAFTTNPARASSDGPISDRFVQAIVSGAQQAQLPAEWVAKLPSFAK